MISGLLPFLSTGPFIPLVFGFQFKLNAAVFLPAGCRQIVGNRFGFAVAFGGNPGGGYAQFAGTSMAAVEAQYGAPESKLDAVGKPPITRWNYPAFTVYFEYDHVVNAVVKKSSPEEIGPKPVATGQHQG